MQAIEENAAYLGVTRLLLMENAGCEVARQVKHQIKGTSNTVLVVSYTGNKAGDAFVAARHLAAGGVAVEILAVSDPEGIKTEEARTNWKIVQNLEKDIKIYSATESSEIRNFFSRKSPSVIIDGILGTGVRGDLREPLITTVRGINSLRNSSLIVAIDVPTGLDPDTGAIHGDAVRAHLTVTHHRYKIGLRAKGAKRYTGKIVLVDIGIPNEAELFVGPGDLRKSIKDRSVYAHKGDSGRLLVVAGSKRYSGSAGLCGLAALRTGVDLVTVAAPESICAVLQSYSPNLIVRSVPGEFFGPEAIPIIRELLPMFDALAIGPGLGLESDTTQSVLKCLSMCRRLKVPVVIDADALKALKGKLRIVQGLPSVLTPHAGEFKVMTGAELPSEQKSGWIQRSEIVRQWAFDLKVTILLKGRYDIISDGARTRVNRTGNPGMTVGGTGDVLTGIVGAFLAWGNSGLEAASASAFLNGMVGDYVATFKGYHLLASDLIDAIPNIVSKYDQNAR